MHDVGQHHASLDKYQQLIDCKSDSVHVLCFSFGGHLQAIFSQKDIIMRFNGG